MTDRIEELKQKYTPEQKATRSVAAIKKLIFPFGVPDYIEKPIKEGVARATDPYGYNLDLKKPLDKLKKANLKLEESKGLKVSDPESYKKLVEQRDRARVGVISVVGEKIMFFKEGAVGSEEDHPLVKEAIDKLELSKKTFEGYHNQDYAQQVIKRRGARVAAMKGRVDLMRLGLGLGQQYGSLEPSQHRPTVGVEAKDVFYDFTEESGLRPSRVEGFTDFAAFENKPFAPNSRNVVENRHSVMRSYTQDTTNPKYTSYYDKWDFLPGIDAALEGTGFYKPPLVYGRIYPEQKKITKPKKRLLKPNE